MSPPKHRLMIDTTLKVVEVVKEVNTRVVNTDGDENANLNNILPLSNPQMDTVDVVGGGTPIVVVDSVSVANNPRVLEFPTSKAAHVSIAEAQYKELFCDGYDSEELMCYQS